MVVIRVVPIRIFGGKIYQLHHLTSVLSHANFYTNSGNFNILKIFKKVQSIDDIDGYTIVALIKPLEEQTGLFLFGSQHKNKKN